MVTPNGVDPEAFCAQDNAAAKRARGLQDRLVLGFVGYVREWHGLDRVVDLLASREAMKNAHLLVVGDGPARAPLEVQAARLGIADRVQFTGTMSRDRLPGLIAAFDIALQPLVTAYASPLKLFEYMAEGRTIVAPATPEYSGNSRGSARSPAVSAGQCQWSDRSDRTTGAGFGPAPASGPRRGAEDCRSRTDMGRKCPPRSGAGKFDDRERRPLSAVVADRQHALSQSRCRRRMAPLSRRGCAS